MIPQQVLSVSIAFRDVLCSRLHRAVLGPHRSASSRRTEADPLPSCGLHRSASNRRMAASTDSQPCSQATSPLRETSWPQSNLVASVAAAQMVLLLAPSQHSAARRHWHSRQCSARSAFVTLQPLRLRPRGSVIARDLNRRSRLRPNSRRLDLLMALRGAAPPSGSLRSIWLSYEAPSWWLRAFT